MFMVLAPAVGAGAGYISLAVSLHAAPSEQGLLVTVNLNNLGDQAAHRLRIQVTAGAGRAETPGPEILPPKQPRTIRLKLPKPSGKPGLYPVLARVFFHDANMYGFCSIASGLFALGHTKPCQVQVRGIEGQVRGKGEVAFDLTNLAGRAINVRLRIFAPRELTLKQKEFDLRLAGRARRRVTVGVENLSALHGASYPILGVLEYDDQGLHHTSLATALARIHRPADPLAALRPWLLAGGLACLGLMVLAEVRRWRRTSS
jgi:hypothetical protein